MHDKEQKRFDSSEAGCLGRAIGSQGVMNERKLRGRAPGSYWMYRLKLEKSGGEEMSRLILVTSHSSCGIVHAAAGERGCFSCSEPVTSARVIGTVSTEEKGKTGRQAGTTDIILYMQQDSDVETKRPINGHGADLTIDGVGKAGFTGNLDAAVLRDIS